MMTILIFFSGVFCGLMLATSAWLFARALRPERGWHSAVIYRKGQSPEYVKDV